MFKQFYYYLLLVLLPLNLTAQNIIRDAEVENIIQKIAAPVIRAAGFKIDDIKFYIVDDNSVNAYTTGSNDIYIYNGLLKNYSNIDTIRGIIAHELGHIAGGHRPSRNSRSESNYKATLGAIGMGLAMSGILKNVPTGTGIAIALGVVHNAKRNLLFYSRVDEVIADRLACQYLSKSGYNVDGLLNFMQKNYLQHRASTKLFNPYDLTHPSDESRFSIIKNYTGHIKYKPKVNDQDLLKEYEFAQVKLRAFTDDPNQYLSQVQSSETTQDLYAKAIIYYRLGMKKEAIEAIDSLLAKDYANPYYNELKGQILFSYGDKDAVKYYRIALNKLPQNTLLKLDNAIITINIFEKNYKELKRVKNSLEQILLTEPNNVTALYYLSVCYDKLQNKGKSLVTMAKFFQKQGLTHQALQYARQAKEKLKTQSAEWLQADDIIRLMKRK